MINRVDLDELSEPVRNDLLQLKIHLTKYHPEFKHVQITLDEVGSENKPTLDIRVIE